MSPHPEARAVADRFMFDTGNLKLLASLLPIDALARQVSALGWTVQGAFAHLAAAQAGYAGCLEALPSSLPLSAAAFDEPRLAADRAVQGELPALPAILDEFDSSLRRLVARLDVLGEEALACRVGAFTVLDNLRAWSAHAAAHAIEMLEALPELRADPMLLNWLLYQDFSDQPTQFALQQTLLTEVRKRRAAEEAAFEEETA
ncbi:MAG: DinB family protein [Tepidiformaceae bacterium]